MNLKRYMQLAILLALPMMILIIGNLEAQYIGSGRPLSRQETLDSLAAKPDTSVTNQLQAEQDSTQDTLDVMYGDIDNLEDAADSLNSNVGAKLDTSAVAAGDNVTVDWDGSNLTIASSGGGGGSNWNPADSTLSLDLPYYFSRNVVDIACKTDDYTSWADKKWDDAAAGVHSDNSTNYLTDWQSITLTDNADDDGIHLDFTDIDLTQFTDSDTSIMADYINWNIYILTQDIADLNDTDGLGLILACDAQGTLTNYFYYLMDDDNLSNGWNHFKVAKSAFTGVGAAVGDSMWNTITGVSLYLDGTPDAEVIVSIDNLQMVRDDPDAAEPNPFQSEGPNGTWTADWIEEENGNMALIEESGIISIANLSLAPATSYLSYKNTLGNFKASGRTRVADVSQVDMLFDWKHNEYLVVNGSVVALHDSAGGFPSVPFVCSDYDVLFWKFERVGSSATGSVSHDGVDWTSISTFVDADTVRPCIQIRGQSLRQRYYSLGISAVEYAAEAGVAQRLLGWHFEILGDSLQVTHGDSLYNILINSRRAK